LRPIFHLSIPVRDLGEALAFYTETLGGTVGRREAEWADVALFGAQLTLQRAPSDVTAPMPRTRHFGATLAWPDWQAITGRLVEFVEGPTIGYEGSEREQGKAMVRDPSGNLIEIKAYRNPAAVLGSLAPL
jgi:uncharacterized protein